MSKEGILSKIELNYPVDQIRVGNQPFWPFFRALIYSELHKSTLRTYTYSRLDILRRVGNAFFGFWQWTRRHDYIIFSNELERKRIDDRYVDKLSEKVIEFLGPHKCLYIEQVEGKHMNKKCYGLKKVVSNDLLLISFVLAKIGMNLRRDFAVEGEEILEQILADHQIQINYRHKLKIFFAKHLILRRVLSYQKPKAVFISDYGAFSITYAAKSLGIKVVELQHGVISHEFYQPRKHVTSIFYPNYLLVFGEGDRETMSHGLYVPAENVLAIGNFYLELVTNKDLDPKLDQLIKGYKTSVCIPTSSTVQEFLFSFVKDVAPSLPDTLFILVPREGRASNPEKALPPNVLIELDLPFQEVARHCTFNTCTYSTCSIESLTLGTQNILIDADGQTSYYLGKALPDQRFTRFVKTQAEYIRTLEEMEVKERIETQRSNARNYAVGYERNLKEALRKISE